MGWKEKRRLRRRSPPSSAPFAYCEAANDVWCIDFKGWFLTGDGERCEPLTITDAHSRYLLRCQALPHTDTEHVWPVLDAAFREFGLPRVSVTQCKMVSVSLPLTGDSHGYGF
ncbi:hypothetical protein AAFX91_26820, partial [Bradyrhizobium sp. 31Argb]